MSKSSTCDQQKIEQLEQDLHRMQEAYLRVANRKDELETENLSLRMRLIRLRRCSGIRGVVA